MEDKLYNHLYKDIVEFRKAFDLPINDTNNLDLMLHQSLLTEEMTELADAKNDVEALDAVIDGIYVRVGMQVNAGIAHVDSITQALYSLATNKGWDFAKGWDIVHASNMSKLCVTLSEATDTEEHYRSLGYKSISIENIDNYFTVKNGEDVTLPCGKFVKTGKVLKSINYTEADLKDCI